ncbi:MAG: hypothetical protein LBQ30_06210 [Treponema sp.]|jgi:hypothetical protein|nr:hypothetical protein [Treponema sp.]
MGQKPPFLRFILAALFLYMDASRTVAQVMEQFEDLEPAARRVTFDVMLRGIVAANPEVLGAWTIGEPNALDAL